jgi:hypothetical protein
MTRSRTGTTPTHSSCARGGLFGGYGTPPPRRAKEGEAGDEQTDLFAP